MLSKLPSCQEENASHAQLTSADSKTHKNCKFSFSSSLPRSSSGAAAVNTFFHIFFRILVSQSSEWKCEFYVWSTCFSSLLPLLPRLPRPDIASDNLRNTEKNAPKHRRLPSALAYISLFVNPFLDRFRASQVPRRQLIASMVEIKHQIKPAGTRLLLLYGQAGPLIVEHSVQRRHKKDINLIAFFFSRLLIQFPSRFPFIFFGADKIFKFLECMVRGPEDKRQKNRTEIWLKAQSKKNVYSDRLRREPSANYYSSHGR